MLATLTARINPRYWTLLALLAWGSITLLLLRNDGYGLDEGAARALLLNWSIVDNIANPIVIFGVPDFRALLFIPLGIYWSGSLLAAKVFTALITFVAGLLLYQSSQRSVGKEVALIASGLLLIAPVTLQQIDALGAGPYLLLVFALGAWLDQGYRDFPRPLGGRYFSQILLAAISVTLHPAGLAYPLALLWRWYRAPLDKRQQRHIFIGVPLAVAFVALLQAGWHGLEWWANPIMPLANALLGPQLEAGSDPAILTGTLFVCALFGVLIVSGRELLNDLLGTALVLAVLLGAVTADLAWSMLALALVLYYGTPKLIALNASLGGPSAMGQRGGVMLVLVLLATLFMNIDKSYYSFVRSGVLASQDQLIHILAQEAADPKQPFRAASQWPGRTMIVVRRDVLPLPPAAKDGAGLLKKITGVTHLAFNPYQANNKKLAANIAELAGAMETIALQPEGVVVKVRKRGWGE